MEGAPSTRPSLLARIRDHADGDAWRVFVDLYTPLIKSLAIRQGLQDADAADVAQDVLKTVASSIQNLDYDPQRGSFRGWLYTVTRSRILDYRRGQIRASRVALVDEGAVALDALPAPPDDPNWDRDYERQLFTWAMEQIRDEFRPATWEAFRRTAIEETPGPIVAEQLEMSLGAVHVARSRVLARLKEFVKPFLDE